MLDITYKKTALVMSWYALPSVYAFSFILYVFLLLFIPLCLPLMPYYAFMIFIHFLYVHIFTRLNYFVSSERFKAVTFLLCFSVQRNTERERCPRVHATITLLGRCPRSAEVSAEVSATVCMHICSHFFYFLVSYVSFLFIF
jgi:hypothetical protein